MKALTIHYPYSQFIIDGVKQFETRHWQTRYRGLVAIHTGKKWNSELQEITESLAESYPLDLGDYKWKEPVLGVIIGICRLVYCHPSESIRDNLNPLERAVGGYADGRFAWEMQVLEVFDEPIPAKGQQGLWEWTPPKGFFDNRVAIVGSRRWNNPDVVDQYVQSLPDDTIVISGGAKGVDSIAEWSARERGLKVISIPVEPHEWNLIGIGKGAGHIRNTSIIGLAGKVVAFHQDNSSGTADSIKKAKRAGKTVIVNPHESPADDSDIRQLRDTVMPIAQDMARTLEIACEELAITGSMRRGKADVKDVELVAVPKFFDGQNALFFALDQLLEHGTIEKALLGKSRMTRWGKKLRSWVYQDVKFDLFVAHRDNFGIEKQRTTGSASFNKYLYHRLKDAPFKVEKFTAYWHGEQLHIRTEQDWFDLLGLPYIAPSQRSADTLQRTFAEEWKGWGKPKKYLPQAKQLKLGGDFDMYNEGAIIEHLSLKAHASNQQADGFEWAKPWLHNDNEVFVYQGKRDGKHHYALAPIDSPEAHQQALNLSSMFYMSETRKLQDWLDDQCGWLKIPYQVVDTGDWSSDYVMRIGATKESVLIEKVIFTQEIYHKRYIRKYLRNPTLYDEDGHIPFGVRFNCSDSIYLINGTHRTLCAMWTGRGQIPMDVCTYDITLAQALCEIEVDNNDMEQMEYFADVLEEAYEILQEAKEKQLV